MAAKATASPRKNLGTFFLSTHLKRAPLNAVPQSVEDRQEIFDIKRQIANTFVKSITIDHNRELHVEVRINLLNLFNDVFTKGLEG